MASIYDDLPFNERFGPVFDAIKNGMWDPQGSAYSGLLEALNNHQGNGYSGVMSGAPFGNVPLPPARPDFPGSDAPLQPNTVQTTRELPPQMPSADVQQASLPQPPRPPNTIPRTQTLGLPDSAPSGEPGAGDRLMAGFGGLANSQGQGLIGKLFNLVGGLATGERQDPTGMALRMQQRNQSEMLKALVDSGVPPGIARAATLNPDLLKQIAPDYFGGWKVVDVDEGPLGKTKMLQGPGGRLVPISTGTQPGGPGAARPGMQPAGNPLLQNVGFQETQAAPGAPGSPAGGEIGFLKGFNWQETDPQKFMDQLDTVNGGPAVKAAVRAYLNGDVMPTGNPRNVGVANAAKIIAQKFGELTGVPVSDTLYAEKRKFRTELGSNTPSSIGGQSKAFVQGIEHAVDLGQTLKKLDNSNGMGIPAVAGVVNTIRQAASNDQQALADKAQGIGQTLAGEVGKLFSGSAGGGVHEREMTRARFSTVRSKPQLAAALEATLETMEGGLTALEARRDAVFGPNSRDLNIELVPKQTREKVNELRQIIADLKGESGGGSAPTKSNIIKWERGPDGKPRPVQ